MSSVLTYNQIQNEINSVSRQDLDSNLFDDVDDDTANETDETQSQQQKKDSKNKRKRVKKKKSQKKHEPATNGNVNNIENNNNKENHSDDEDIEIELVPEEIVLDKNYAEFAKVFDHFKLTGPEGVKEGVKIEEKNPTSTRQSEMERLRARMMEDDEEDEKEKEAAEKDGQPKLSKKKLKQVTRLSVAALKQLVNRPDVVEMHDVTARDPKLLVHLKATRNTVPVPRHWCAKRKYLQGKRGFEKPAFDLPDFIKRTGIQGMREAVAEKEANKSLKQKMREKVRPKMGKIDIDYQKLHDAFFRWQTKPRMCIHGDLYYEGKEMETKLKEKKPGNLTDDLRIALGMPTGANSEKIPPPWLIAMQRYGPPPSYPSLKIPGLNAPIPDSCSFGYHAGGWGKPPVDEFGRPLYGDVFGSSVSDMRKPEEEEPVDKGLWGEMEDEVYEEVMPEDDSEEEEDAEGEKGEGDGEKEDEEAPEDDTAGLKTPGEGLMTPSGISTTVSAGLETPDMIELRKRKNQIESDMESMGGETPALYKILPEKATSVGASMMGSSKVYDISAAKKANLLHEAMMGGTASGIDMTLNPDELEMDSDTLQSRFDQQVKQSGEETSEPDLAKQKQKKPKAKPATTPASGSSSSTADKDKNKKYKEFKF